MSAGGLTVIGSIPDWAGEEDAEVEESVAEEARADNATLEKEYWNDVFAASAQKKDWLLSFSTVGRFVLEALTADDSGAGLTLPRLVVGTGNSAFGPELQANLGGEVRCSDFSEVVIEQMSKAYERPGLEFEVQDARCMTYESGSARAIVDKSLIDCMLYAEACDPEIAKFVSEVHRVLVPGGTALFLTHRGPDILEAYLGKHEWSSCAYVPIAAECDDEGSVGPRALGVLDSEIDAHFGKEAVEDVDYEIFLLYICNKASSDHGVAPKSPFRIELAADISRYAFGRNREDVQARPLKRQRPSANGGE